LEHISLARMLHPLLPQDDDCHKLAPKLQSPSTWELTLSEKPLRTYILHEVPQSRLGLRKPCDHFGEAQHVIHKGKPRYRTYCNKMQANKIIWESLW